MFSCIGNVQDIATALRDLHWSYEHCDNQCILAHWKSPSIRPNNLRSVVSITPRVGRAQQKWLRVYMLLLRTITWAYLRKNLGQKVYTLVIFSTFNSPLGACCITGLIAGLLRFIFQLEGWGQNSRFIIGVQVSRIARCQVLSRHCLNRIFVASVELKVDTIFQDKPH